MGGRPSRRFSLSTSQVLPALARQRAATVPAPKITRRAARSRTIAICALRTSLHTTAPPERAARREHAIVVTIGGRPASRTPSAVRPLGFRDRLPPAQRSLPKLEPAAGFEPATCTLRGCRSSKRASRAETQRLPIWQPHQVSSNWPARRESNSHDPLSENGAYPLGYAPLLDRGFEPRNSAI